VEVNLHTFLTLAPGRGEWSASCFSHFTSEETATDTHWIGGWVGLRANMVLMESNLNCSVCSQSLYRL